MAAGGPGLTGTFSGAVLCGGASTRMGRDKATLEVGGIAMSVRVARALREAGAAEVLAIGGTTEELEALGLRVVPDDEPGEGPFAATLTALRAAAGDVVVVLSCDLLDPSATAVVALVDRLQGAPRDVQGAVPVAEGHEQWTHAAWRRSALAAFEAAHAAGARSLQRAAAGLTLILVDDLPPAALADVDDPRDLPGAG